MKTYADINYKTEKELMGTAEGIGCTSDGTMAVLYLKLISERLANIADELHQLNEKGVKDV